MTTVDELMTQAFSVPRDPRSTEYKAGVRAALDYRLNGKKMLAPFRIGTTAADAYFAGTDEGHRIWRNLSTQKQD
ncbi:hypothetical protein D3870_21360 [Noviherbaspirillum cavernae]|uniref:Uncharacterized protein n=1 Tax=Noviherbaspirillum cavernae TaxID=2320862 RepID=A0A418WW94_9BURK|nr:hypothetical protein [Noviherbaspirillum cavernae]RJF96918.1 hypothetical protein D3870_21360 [Noviherbaspirillum cavernae]